jgi:RNA recognition motif-containing protein
MGKKLYVGNLPFSATEDSLKEVFAQFGTVESVIIITDRDCRSPCQDVMESPPKAVT